ncbi:MAG: SDR family NAD(P)-dependent oxidoreductase [Myxococcota bacterium]
MKSESNAPSTHLSARWQRYGPWAVITGASDGIGRQIAEQLADAGLNLVLVARREAILGEMANAIRTRSGVEVTLLAADLSQRASVQHVLDATAALDVGLLVAAAGFGTSGDLIDGDLEQELNMVDVNCRALLHMVHAFGRRLRDRGRGGIILMSSLVGFQGVPRAANYAGTKAYVQSLAEGLSHELGPLGVDVIASAPGPVHSGFAARANMRMSSALTPKVVARETLARLGHARVVRPGFMTKFLLLSLSLLPRWMRVRIVGQVMYGMTKHQLAHRAA